MQLADSATDALTAGADVDSATDALTTGADLAIDAKAPRACLWKGFAPAASYRLDISLAGRRTMTTAIKLREVAYPSPFAAAA